MASDPILEASVESCENWALAFGAVLLVGILGEVISPAVKTIFPSLETLWTIAANALVFIGVAGELRFGRMGIRRQTELLNRSNCRLAKVTEANSELQKRLSPRMLTVEGKQALEALKGKIEALNIASPTSNEPFGYAWSICEVLTQLGVKSAIYELGTPTKWPIPMGAYLCDLNMFNPAFGEKMKLLEGTLIAAGILGQHGVVLSAQFPPHLAEPPPTHAPLIVIGERPPAANWREEKHS